MKHLIYIGFLLFLVSCTTLGYDPHNKPVPPQPGKTISISYSDKKGISIPLTAIEKPVNHESGWDTDDLVLVFKSPLIDPNLPLKHWNWGSDSWWTKYRLRSGSLIGYGGRFSGRILPGEIRLYCGSREQFLVNLETIYLLYNPDNIKR